MKNTDKPLLGKRIALLGTLALTLPSVGLFAAGAGTSEDPFTGEDVTAVMDGGTAEAAAYYAITADTDFGTSTGIYVGQANPKNNLTITGPATINAYLIRLGDTATSTGNVATITDGTLNLTSSIRVGKLGNDNAMSISGTSTVVTGESGYASLVGDGLLSDSKLGCSNELSISGTTWTNSDSFAVGNYGSDNSFSLLGAATMTSSEFVVGMGYVDEAGLVDYSALGSNNEATIDGAGTKLTIDNIICVGNFGSGNSMTISAGATVEVGDETSVPSIKTAAIALPVSAISGEDIISAKSSAITAKLSSISNSGLFYVGRGSNNNAALGCDNSLVVSGADTVLDLNYSRLYVGYYGSNNSLKISDGATVTQAYDLRLCGENGTNNSFTVSGGASFDCSTSVRMNGSESSMLFTGAGTYANLGSYIDLSGSNNTLTVSNAATAETTSDFSVSGTGLMASAQGEGSILSADYISISGTSGTLSISAGALVKASDLSISTGTDAKDYLLLRGGFLALAGDQTTDVAALITAGLIKVWDQATYAWVAGTTETVTVHYYSQSDEDPAATPKVATSSDTFAGYDDLIGYTLVSGGDELAPYTLWADSADASTTELGEGWYGSPWYGPFYATTENDGLIFSDVHAWQYIYDYSTVAVGTYLWDCGSASWWYTSSTLYPYMYQFTVSSADDGSGTMVDTWSGAWYYYRSGISPERIFWNFATDGEVAEATLAQ